MKLDPRDIYRGFEGEGMKIHFLPTGISNIQSFVERGPLSVWQIARMPSNIE
jgi:hypothetical protein